MTVTTIKVPVELRDELKRQAAAHDRTLAQHLSALARSQARADRLGQARQAVVDNPPDEAYLREAGEWTGPGWM